MQKSLSGILARTVNLDPLLSFEGFAYVFVQVCVSLEMDVYGAQEEQVIVSIVERDIQIRRFVSCYIFI